MVFTVEVSQKMRITTPPKAMCCCMTPTTIRVVYQQTRGHSGFEQHCGGGNQDAVLVADKDKVQEVKKIVDQLKSAAP